MEKVPLKMQEKAVVHEFINCLKVDFPASDIMSLAARSIEENICSYGIVNCRF